MFTTKTQCQQDKNNSAGQYTSFVSHLPPGLTVKLLVLATVFLCVCNSSDASVLSVRCFLATAQHDCLLQNANEKVGFLQATSPNTPFFDKVELRTQTDEFELSRERYSVRLYPNGLGETKAGRKIWETSLQRSRIQRELLLHQALKKRYLLVIDLLCSKKILAISRQIKSVYEDMVTALEKSRNSLDFDINDLIGASDDLTKAKLEIIELEARVQSVENSILSYMLAEGPIAFSTENLAGIDVIRNLSQHFGDTPAPDNVYVKDSSLRVEIAKSRHALEKAQGRRYIRFLEVSYDNEERDDSSRAYFVELGITLPFVNSNRLDINRRKLQLLTAQTCDKELKRTLEEGLATCSGDIKRLLKEYAVLTEIKQQTATDSLLKAYMQVEGISPLVLLEMKESILKRNIALEKIRNELFISYIELLDITGKLSEKPLKNYISADLEFITPCEQDVRK